MNTIVKYFEDKLFMAPVVLQPAVVVDSDF